jgi:opacity protein-like surface antigen
MKTILLLLFAIVTLGFSEIPLVTLNGVGARSLGMGNNFTACANDYSAVFWNPAGLAFTPSREIHVGLGVTSSTSTTGLGSVSTDYSKSSLYFSSAGLVRSIPTKQGGLTFAFGYSSPYSFEDLQRFRGNDVYLGADTQETVSGILYPGDMLHYDDYKLYVGGKLGLFTGAAGWQVAERLGFGLSVSFIYGTSTATKSILSHTGRGYLLDDGSDSRSETHYTGFDVRIGGMYKITDHFSSGIRIEIPQTIRYSNKITDNFGSEKHYGSLKSSLSGAAGLAYTFPFSTISADVQFRSPNPEIDDGDLSHWKAGAGAGIEIPIPKTNALLRGGYSWKQSDLFPYAEYSRNGTLIDNNNYIDGSDDIHMFTAGATFMISDAILLELAYSNTRFSSKSVSSEWLNTLDKTNIYHKGNVTVSVQY